MPPMKPSAEERAKHAAGYLNEAFGVAREIQIAYRDGFAAALAMLKTPTEAVLDAAWLEIEIYDPGREQMRAALAAAADAMEKS